MFVTEFTPPPATPNREARKLRFHAILMYMRVQAKKRRAANGPVGVHALQASRFRAGSLEAELEAIASKIPKRDLRRLPRDLASHVDHYLYGAPKR